MEERSVELRLVTVPKSALQSINHTFRSVLNSLCLAKLSVDVSEEGSDCVHVESSMECSTTVRTV